MTNKLLSVLWLGALTSLLACGQEGERVGTGGPGPGGSGTGASGTGAAGTGGVGDGGEGTGGNGTGTGTATGTGTGTGTGTSTSTGTGTGTGSGGEDCANNMDDDGDMDVDCADSDCAMAPVCGDLLLNEVDYDTVGTDDAEFVEVYNAGAGPVDLTNVSVELVNGNGNTVYDSVALSGTLQAGGYLVVADSGVVVAGGAIKIDRGSFSIQQGPDAVALYDSATATVLDGLSYEGDLGMVDIDGNQFSLVDGTPTAAEDSNTVERSIARIPNAQDTGNDAADWAEVATPTPGAAN